MRKENWNTNKVYYQYLDDNKKTIINRTNGSPCYSEFNSSDFKNNGIFVLMNFNKPETTIYIKDYLNQLSKIFKCKIVYINDDKIEVINFKNYYHLKIFATMFRYLFENGHDKPERNVEFIKSFVEDKRTKDVLWKFIDNFNNVKFNNGNWNHCISKNNSVTPLNLRTIKDLNNNKWTGYQPIHDFFNKK